MRLPAGIWALGLVSLLMDTSSELVHSLLPVYLSDVLGASVMAIGLIEGVAEATASVVKVFSGVLSDWLGRRKLLAVAGYGLAALTKPVFPLAGGVGWVFGARFVDRIGKGIRGAPRDALVAELAPPALRGAAFGLRQALDSVGAFLGPLAALALMAWLAGNIRAVLWIAVAPAALAVFVLVVGVREPPPISRAGRGGSRRLRLTAARHLPAAYWWIVILGGLLTLARFSEAFLVLRTRDLGLPVGRIPLVLIVMNVVYAASSYPAGRLADRLSHRKLLVCGLLVLSTADLLLAAGRSVSGGLAGVALWGLHLGLTQGLLSKLIADNSPADLRGTAFGVFNLVCGLMLLLASMIAGAMWTRLGAPATFLAGAAFTGLALLVVLARPPATDRTQSLTDP